jgi:3'(2'), 5'-bisphosphate nucleotidase
MTRQAPTPLRSAIDIVADACRVARAVQRNLENVRKITKDDRSPVTVADFAVQAIVQLGLAMHDEKPLIVGEERATLLRDPDQAAVLDAVVEAVHNWREHITVDEILAAIDACDHDGSADAYWTLDPIDGTKGFLRGQQYAVALARIENGQVSLGVMGCPNLAADHGASVAEADARGTIYAATKGGGAWQLAADKPAEQPDRITIATLDPTDAIRACESVESEHSKQSDTHRILEEIGGAGEPVRLDSQCKYAVVARGQADAYLRLPTKKDYVEKIWDHAAGMLIAEEAGAVVSDVTGAPLDFTQGRRLENNRGIICAVPDIHPRIIDAIDRLGIAAAV